MLVNSVVHLRSAADGDAANSVGEAVGEHAGDVIVHDLHLATLELSDLVQADLVLLGVLGRDKGLNDGVMVAVVMFIMMVVMVVVVVVEVVVM